MTQSLLTRRGLLTGGIVLAAGGAALWAYDRRAVYDGGDLTVAEAHAAALSGDILLIDIRRPDEWAATGVGEGAQPLDMRRKDFVAALTTLTGGRTDTPVALICAAGVRSARLSRRLTEAGFTKVLNVPEGMRGSKAGPGWVRSGLPTVAWTG